jgi:hypothetical protein
VYNKYQLCCQAPANNVHAIHHAQLSSIECGARGLPVAPADAVAQQQGYRCEVEQAQVWCCGEAAGVYAQGIHSMLEEEGHLGAQ